MKKPALILFIFFALFLVSAQDEESAKVFPTRLSVNSTDSTIGLTWKPSGQGETGYVIYRYTETVSAENFSLAEKISEIESETTFFEDFPPAKDVPYYYAVLAVDAFGQENEIFIPFGNINLYGVSVLYIENEEEQLVEIKDLQVQEENGTVTLSFESVPAGREILIYRNTSPILASENLLDAILIDRVLSGTGTYIDTPISGVEYYYALVGSRAFKKGNISFVDGANSSSRPIILPTTDDSIYSVDADFELRSRPLPYLSSGTVYQNSPSSRVMERIPEVPLDEDLQYRLSALIAEFETTQPMELTPTILPEDLDEESASWDPRLATILMGEFSSGDYEKALNLLIRYQKLPANRDMEYRTHFYLGQIYYFLGNYEKSLVEFIFAEENFFIACKPWLNVLFRVSDLIES